MRPVIQSNMYGADSFSTGVEASPVEKQIVWQDQVGDDLQSYKSKDETIPHLDEYTNIDLRASAATANRRQPSM